MGITQDTGHMRVVQMQGETKVARDRSSRHLSGLFNGLDWRRILMNGQVVIARRLGVAAVEMDGTQKRYWSGMGDALASLGFTGRADGDWILKL